MVLLRSHSAPRAHSAPRPRSKVPGAPFGGNYGRTKASCGIKANKQQLQQAYASAQAARLSVASASAAMLETCEQVPAIPTKKQTKPRSTQRRKARVKGL
jgi:hypothetical protein